MKRNKLTTPILLTIIAGLSCIIVVLLLTPTKNKFPMKDGLVRRPLGIAVNDTINADSIYTDPLGYGHAKIWRTNYLNHKNKLPVQGFTIEKSYVTSLFNNNNGCDLMYVFFGAENPNGNITMIFSELKDTAINGQRDTVISQTLLYEYVRPCLIGSCTNGCSCPKFY